jgi:hypothetical protein
MPHTHLTGKEVIVTQVRDNKEIGYIVNNKNYDFNYQYFNFLAEPIKFKRVELTLYLYSIIITQLFNSVYNLTFKGDEIKVKCVYNTAAKSNFTYVI